MQRTLEWFGLRENPADDDGLGTYLLGWIAVMLVATSGAPQTTARNAWWWLYGIALMALLVGRASLPARDWRVKAIAGVAAAAFTPLGIALVFGSEPSGPALVFLIAIPAVAAGLVVQRARGDASSPARGR